MFPRPTIEKFDAFLDERDLRFEAVVIGGSALALLGLTDRQTRDVDILHPKLPDPIRAAALEFADVMKLRNVELGADWLNNGPEALAEVLPAGWEMRLQTVFEGEALTLTTLGRSDLLKSKLFALCDRGTDLADCLAMAPTSKELDQARNWVARQDAHPDWPAHVQATLKDLERRLDDAI